MLQGWVCSQVPHWLYVALKQLRSWGNLWSETQDVKFGTKDYVPNCFLEEKCTERATQISVPAQSSFEI